MSSEILSEDCLYLLSAANTGSGRTPSHRPGQLRQMLLIVVDRIIARLERELDKVSENA